VPAVASRKGAIFHSQGGRAIAAPHAEKAGDDRMDGIEE
jgi:hypothetical protein